MQAKIFVISVHQQASVISVLGNIKKRFRFLFLITLRGFSLISACCCVRRWQGVSSRPGVEAVCEGSSFVYRPHNGPQQELYTRLPVSTWDRPTGGWADLKQLCTYTYSNGSHVVDGPYFQDGVCVWESDCRCDVNGEQHKPGDTVFTDCRNW